MGYRRGLLVRWSRRDRLAILIVALSVAFLVGTTLVVLAAGSQTAAIAAEFGTTGQVTLHGSTDAAQAAVSSSGLVLPYATVTTPEGPTTIVVARPTDSSTANELGLGGEGVTVGPSEVAGSITLRGSSGSVTVDPTARGGDSVLPPTWYLAPPETVAELGTEGALTIEPASDGAGPGAPLRAALLFFLLGTREALTALSVAGIGAGVLVGVTVYGVTRMGVRDRLATIRIVRSTGATPRTVLGLFTLRAALLTAVGASLGYALGVILPNAAVSVAIATGQSVSLPLTIDIQTASAILPLVAAPIGVGAVAGALAAYPAATRPPGRIDDPHGLDTREGRFGLPAGLRPRLLDRRLVVPTAATLAAFVILATVAAGLGTALGPIAAADTRTVVEPGTPHPLASQVPEAYADALADRGIDASGEILLLEVVDGRPFIAVGAEFDAFAAVHDARLVAGRAPAAPGEVAIGSSLAAALEVAVGDRLVLGGSTQEGLTLVTVVGRFDATGATASQLVVPLGTARHLAGVPAGSVHLVSAERLPSTGGADAGAVGVVDVSLPNRVPANTTATVRITLRNEGLEPASHSVNVRSEEFQSRQAVEVGPLRTRMISIEVPVGSPGRQPLHVNDLDRAIRVVDPTELAIVGLPNASPVDGRPLLRVETLTGAPVEGATVSVGNRSWTTGADGRTRIEFDTTGERRIVATAGNRSTSTTIAVSETASRRLDVSLAVRPSNPSVLVQPTAHITVSNPWAVPIERTLVLDGATQHSLGTISVSPGETTTLDVPLERRAPGRYDLVLRADGSRLAETSYRVTGDDRLAAALASSGRDGGSGLSQAFEAALGNLQLVLAVVLGLAALMTVGATAATFAAGVQARRRTLGVHRATGADPGRILRLVLLDALRLGAVATAVGLPVGLAAVYGFSELGVLTALGVRVPPVPSTPVVAGIVVAAVVLTALGAGLATIGVLRATPSALLAGSPSHDAPMEALDD